MTTKNIGYLHNDVDIIERLSRELERRATLTEIMFESRKYDNMEAFREYIEKQLVSLSANTISKPYTADIPLNS
ncbi:MAG: hypothetical protein FWG45_01850 [Oscillospiraceae bacterium]|nr:hypothetical protein [Oscillospiraceae bacterium]